MQMMMIPYFYTEDVDDDGLNDDVLMKPLSNTFETSLVLFENTFLKRGSSDVAVGLYHPWELALK